MKKSDYILILSLLILTVMGLYIWLPNTVAAQEATDFYVSEPTFLHYKLSQAPGVTSIVSNWILQLYRWVLVGCIVEGVLLALMAWLCAQIPTSLGRKGYTALALLAPLMLLLAAPLDVSVALQGVCFFAYILCGLHIKRKAQRNIYVELMPWVGYLFMSWPLIILASIAVAWLPLLDVKKGKSDIKSAIVGTVGAILIAFACVWMSNRWIGFIPLDRRYLYSPIEGVGTLPFILFSALSVGLMLVPRWQRAKSWMPLTLGLVLIVGTMIACLSDKQRRSNEQQWYLSYLADHHQWKKILEMLPEDRGQLDKPSAVYGMLAELNLGTLPEHLNQYPIANGEDFLFRGNSKAMCCNFNRQFYESIGVWDEAYRQTVQMGMKCKEGTSLSCQRHMLNYAIAESDWKVADKLLAVMKGTTWDASMAKKAQRMVDENRHRVVNKPLTDTVYVGMYEMTVELEMLLRKSPDNRQLLDLYLCSLLLDRRLPLFARTLTRYDYYQIHPLPRAYAEACILVETTNDAPLMRQFHLPDMMRSKFDEFYSKLVQNHGLEGLSKYKGSYWYYFFEGQQLLDGEVVDGTVLGS